jgi:hypothetical protein
MRFTRTLLQLQIVSLILAYTGIGQAANIEFDNGAANNLWSNPTNWNPNTLPGSNDVAQIFSGHTAVINQPSANAQRVSINDNATLSIMSGDLTVDQTITVGGPSAGTVVQSGGTVQTTGNNGEVIVNAFGLYELSGGVLDIGGDLSLMDGSTFRIVGAATLNIGDDVRTTNNGLALLEIVLVGNTVPTINVEDRLNLDSEIYLNIDTTQWTGGPSSISPINVSANGNIVGNFNGVSVNGVPLDPSQYSVGSGGISFQVTEPSGGLTTLLAIGILCMLLRRRRESSLQAVARRKETTAKTGHRFDQANPVGRIRRPRLRKPASSPSRLTAGAAANSRRAAMGTFE